MKRYLLSFLLMCITLYGYSQEQDDHIFIDPDVPAVFPGGEDSLRKYIARSLRFPTCQEVWGTVYIEFIVEKNGTITEAKVVKNLSPLYDEEALRVVKAMPPWIPGTRNGQPIRMKMVIPIRFKIGR